MSNNRIIRISILVFVFLLIIHATILIIVMNSQLNYISVEIAELRQQLLDIKNTKISDIKKLKATAYSPRKQETDSTPYITASMNKVRHGIVAVSRDLFEQGWTFGRKVYIEGVGIFVIDDLMNSRFTNKIDIFVWDTKEALKFGQKERLVVLLKN